MLKKLYQRGGDNSSSRVSQASSYYKMGNLNEKKTQ